MEQVYHLVVHRPKSVLFLLVLLTAFFASHARHIHLDSSVESLLSQDDPEQQYYDKTRRLFGSDNVVVVGIIADTIYTPQTLHKIKRLTEEFRKIPEVKNVFSLTNATDIVANVSGEQSDLLIPEIPEMAEGAAALKNKLANQPLYLNLLVSADGRAAAINIAFLDSITDEEFLRRGLDEKIQALVDSESGPEKLYYTSLPHMKAASAKAMQEDLTYLLPLTFLFIVAALYLCFRSVRGVVLPALTVIISLIWTLGIMVLTGHLGLEENEFFTYDPHAGVMVLTDSYLGLSTVALPLLLLVLGTAYALHVVVEYYELARPGRSTSEVVLETLRKTGPPICITALITVLGFLSLCLHDTKYGLTRIVGLREMGLYASAGIIIASFLSMTLVPALLDLLHLPAKQRETFSPAVSSALRRLCQGDIRHRRGILGASLLLTALSLWQSSSIQVGVNFHTVFREDDPIRQATEAMNQYFGSMAFYVVIESDEKDIMKKWDTLRKIKDFQLYLNALPGVKKTLSLVDYCEAIDKGLQVLPPENGTAASPQPQAQVSFWDDQARLTNILQVVFLNPGAVSGFVNHPTYSHANILVRRTSLSQPEDLTTTVEKLQAWAQEHFPPELKVRATGNFILRSRAAKDIIDGQVQSLGVGAFIIFVIMSAIFLSARVGGIAMSPYLFSVWVFLGFMGISGIVFNLGTSIIVAVALGLTIDNTVHFMTRLSFERRAGAEQEQALLQTLTAVGKPSLYVSFSLFLGFLVFCLSAFAPIREFGLLSATAMVIPLAGSVVLLPALLAPTRILTVWDLLYTVTQLTQKLEQRVAERTRELQEVNRQLEAASRHKSEFLARMSHELRTPMNAIIGFTRLVMRRSQNILPKRDHENLGKVLISAEHLLTLINDILDLSKVEAGRMEVRVVSFELEPLIELCLRTVEPLVKSERLRLVKELEVGIPPLSTDQDKLKQILINLLSNAIKFTEVGTITVTARCRDEEVAISVADTGIGIPAEQLELVFEEFHQVDSSATRQYSGTGLGLSISRHFARLLGGDITLQSTVEAGATFTVTIPRCCEAAQPATHVAKVPSREAVAATPEIDKMRSIVTNNPQR